MIKIMMKIPQEIETEKKIAKEIHYVQSCLQMEF